MRPTPLKKAAAAACLFTALGAGVALRADAAMVTGRKAAPNPALAVSATETSPTTADVRWTYDALANDGLVPTRFEVEACDQIGIECREVAVTNGAARTAPAAGLKAKDMTIFKVWAFDTTGRRIASNSTVVVTGMLPGPTGVTARALSETKAEVAWAYSNADATFTVKLCPTAGSCVSSFLPAGARSATIDALVPGERYRVQVLAQQANGSSWDGWNQVSVLMPGTFAPTSLLTSSASSTALIVAWQGATDVGVDIVVTEISEDDPWFTSGARTSRHALTSPAVIDGLKPDTLYEVRLTRAGSSSSFGGSSGLLAERRTLAAKGSAALTGTVVKNGTTTKIAGAEVAIYRQAFGTWVKVATVQTDSNGAFASRDLVAGLYRVGYTKAGFVPSFHSAATTLATARTTTIKAGRTINLTGRLDPAPVVAA